jgi:aldose sugar dehydrogenase
MTKDIEMPPSVHHNVKLRLAICCCGLAIMVFVIFAHGGYYSQNAYAAYTKAVPIAGGPTLIDPNLKAEVVFKGLEVPTSMAFLGPNDILVLEKNKGTVDRIVDGQMIKQPLLHVKVATEVEHGMLGIAVAGVNKGGSVATTSNAEKSKDNTKDEPGSASVFLYYTQGNRNEEQNKLYRYELANNQLTNPKLLLTLPAVSPDLSGENNNHNGGKLVIGPDNNIYTVIGDVGGREGQAQNVNDGDALDGTSGILRITQDGASVGNGIFGSDEPASLYYAYGIRNSFGMDFDPVTHKLWDTENGPTFGDEVNLVNPGFNSGWSQVIGIWKAGANPGSVIGTDNNSPPKNLVSFGGKGVYRTPEFTWLPTIGPTALKFLDSARLGSQYQNDMFVGDVNTGNLYYFKLNQNRDGLVLNGAVADKVANSLDELNSVIFGKGFGTITDLQVGPDGYLYVLTVGGTIYRIVPLHPISNNVNNGKELGSTTNTPSTSSTINNNNIPSPSNNQQPTPNQQHQQKTSNNESNNSAGGVIGTIIPGHTPSRIIK